MRDSSLHGHARVVERVGSSGIHLRFRQELKDQNKPH